MKLNGFLLLWIETGMVTFLSMSSAMVLLINYCFFLKARQGIQMFCMSWPRMRNPNKPPKPHHAAGYNWSMHPGFPQHFSQLWRPVY